MPGLAQVTAPHGAGFSMVEAMVGITVFLIAALGVSGVHQKLTRDATKARLNEKVLEYMACEVDRLNRITRIPERDAAGNLVYRDSSNAIVASGGTLVPYGYNNLLVSGASTLNSTDAVVTYPDVLDSQNTSANQTQVQLKRRYVVETVN